MNRAVNNMIGVGVFAIAMAYVESAVVVYLRALYGIEDLLLDMPELPDQYTLIELGREASTLVMLIMIGWVAGRKLQDRFGYTIIVFGLWDIFYYIWLAVFIGWPKSLLDWDFLFLIPLPWWGPVLSPTLIALMLIAGGVIAVVKAEQGIVLKFSIVEWSVACASILLALYVFMMDSIDALPEGIEAVGRVKPTVFNWPLFSVALAGMAFFLLRALLKNNAKNLYRKDS